MTHKLNIQVFFPEFENLLDTFAAHSPELCKADIISVINQEVVNWINTNFAEDIAGAVSYHLMTYYNLYFGKRSHLAKREEEFANKVHLTFKAESDHELNAACPEWKEYYKKHPELLGLDID